MRSCKGDGTGGGMTDSKKGPAMKPRGIICYICGKEYGTASIDIHIKSCTKRWETDEAQKPVRERRPVPKPPQNYDMIKAKGSSLKQKDMDAFNEEAFKQYSEESRVPCPFCARKFLPDRLEVHLRSCGKGKSPPPKAGFMSPQPTKSKAEGAGSSGGAGKGPGTSPTKMMVKPKALICYICGKEYGTHSLDIHLKTCKKKWEEEQAAKPPGERKPLPEPPKMLDDVRKDRSNE